MSETNSARLFPQVDGGLLIDKPKGLTSHDVVARVRRLLHVRRAGHTGTLDPLATGLLVLLLGRATRLAQFLMSCEKQYLAGVQLGVATDTYDATGRPTFATPHSFADLPVSQIESALTPFRGKIEQIPPMYSAKKRGGVSLHRLARRGVEVERSPVRVTIHELELLGVERGDPGQRISLRVRCSSGTYIRSLVHDLGRRLGCGAHLASLRRTAAGEFSLASAHTLDELEAPPPHDLGAVIIPPARLLAHLPSVQIEGEQLQRVTHGAAIPAAALALNDGEPCRILDSVGELVAVADFAQEGVRLVPRVVLKEM